MKSATTYLIFLLISLHWSCFAQNWTALNDMSGSGWAGRRNTATFTIGNTGYVCGGFRTTTLSDLWSYNTINDSWTQKSDIPQGRFEAVGFALGNYGFVGCGIQSAGGLSSSFYKYNPDDNSWTAVTNNIPAGGRAKVAFVIGNYAYVGTGFNGSYLTSFYRFDPSNETWLVRASITSSRKGASAFSIGNYGYVGNGLDNLGSVITSWSRYDPVSNLWTAIADYPGTPSFFQASFSDNTYGYTITGGSGNNAGYPSGVHQEFYLFDPTTNAPKGTWTLLSPFPGGARWGAAGFTIGNCCYLVSGSNDNTDLWKWDSGGCVTLSNSSSPFAGNEEIKFISVFPNPASNFFEYSLSSMEDQKITLTIIDDLGRTVFTRESFVRAGLTMDKIFTNMLTRGNYMIRITNGNNEKTQKLLVVE